MPGPRENNLLDQDIDTKIKNIPLSALNVIAKQIEKTNSAESEINRLNTRPIPSAVYVVEEPDLNVFLKWLGWVVAMVIFVWFLIYVTNQMTKDECDFGELARRTEF
jgi:hypothetical protein